MRPMYLMRLMGLLRLQRRGAQCTERCEKGEESAHYVSILARIPHQSMNGSRIRIVSSRSGPWGC